MGEDKANMAFIVAGFHQLRRPKLGNYFSEVFCDVYLPLIKAATTAAGLVICCITSEEKFHYCVFTFVFCNCRAKYPGTYKNTTMNSSKEEKLI